MPPGLRSRRQGKRNEHDSLVSGVAWRDATDTQSPQVNGGGARPPAWGSLRAIHTTTTTLYIV